MHKILIGLIALTIIGLSYANDSATQQADASNTSTDQSLQSARTRTYDDIMASLPDPITDDAARNAMRELTAKCAAMKEPERPGWTNYSMDGCVNVCDAEASLGKGSVLTKHPRTRKSRWERCLRSFQLARDDVIEKHGSYVETPNAGADKKVELEPAAVITPSEEKQAKPVKSAAASDPFFEYCQSENMHRYYDCSCMAAKAPALRAEITDGFDSSPEGQHQKNRLRQYREMLANESDPQKRTNIERGIKRTEENIARAKDPSQIPMSTLSLRLGKTAAPKCKSADYLRKDRLDSCMRGEDETKRAFCTCVADNVANRWLADNSGLSSSWIVNMTLQANRECG